MRFYILYPDPSVSASLSYSQMYSNIPGYFSRIYSNIYHGLQESEVPLFAERYILLFFTGIKYIPLQTNLRMYTIHSLMCFIDSPLLSFDFFKQKRPVFSGLIYTFSKKQTGLDSFFIQAVLQKLQCRIFHPAHCCRSQIQFIPGHAMYPCLLLASFHL